jgi:RNA polymerase sigma-70 factor (ECF subfamily)
VEGVVTDDELMARGAGGDERAFQVLVERWERPVFAFLVRMLGSREEAQDVGQETFLRLCREAGRYEPRGQFRSWLFRIAGNLARSRLRRRKIVRWVTFERPLHDRPAPGPPAGEALEREERRMLLAQALAELPERQRLTVLLRHDEGMSQREIAATLGTSESAVESLLQRALATLRRKLRSLETERAS